MSVLRAVDVSIRYLTGDFKDIGLKEYVVRNLKGNYNVHEFWADRHITFELERGDMLGIIGTNGAGKSTLLKAISGIMIPTEGSIEIKGKIAALLELASGFDDDLTVRENTYLRGAMLGYTRKFMDEQYEYIIKFAELENFQDRTFKQLSSGMKSRLAFSIACLVNPDIIILDEVLSVGDGAFRDKSARRMKDILESGVTGILVSHSVEQVRQICNKVLWLDHGKQVGFSDDVDAYCNAYEMYLKGRDLPKNDYKILELSSLYEKERLGKINITFEEEINIDRNNLLDTLGKRQENFQYFKYLTEQYEENANYARIDIRNESGTNSDIVVSTSSDLEYKETMPDWFRGYGIGHVIESNSGELDISIKCLDAGCLNIGLKSIDLRDSDGVRIPVWIQFKSFNVDGSDFIKKPVFVWHNQPYIYTSDVKEGQIVHVRLTWEKG